MLSLSKWESSLKDIGFRLRDSVPSMYVLFAFERFQNLQLGILRMLMEYVVSNLFSECASWTHKWAENFQNLL